MKASLVLLLIPFFQLLSAPSFALNTTAQLLKETVVVKPVLHNKVKHQSKQYIVQFNDDSLTKMSRLMTVAQKQQKNNLNALRQAPFSLSQHKQLLAQKRTGFMLALKSKHADAKMLRQYSSLLNGVAVTTNLGQKELSKLDNVKAVYPVQRYKKKMSNLLPIIDAPESWALLGGREEAGKGIRIAVIDSGIIQDHPMFDDTGMSAPTNLPIDDYCHTSDVNFCNNKLIVARHYIPDFINVNNESEYDSPQGLSGHGSHVAGIATGRQVTAPNGDVISGVAPGAYLMVYKTLWGQDGEGSDIELLAALEDAKTDGANVINNSWGGDNGQHPANTLYKELFEELEANGIVVVTAAGNEGLELGSKSIACPGCIEAGITVGATTTDLSTGLPVTFSDQTYYATSGDNFAINSDINAQVTLAPSSNELGCSAWEDDVLAEKIAVVTRGTCFFEEKANMAEAAGAIALIVINNETEANIRMSMGNSTLPAILISISDGNKLVEAYNQAPNVALTIGANLVVSVDPNLQDWVADFSSLGPNGDDSFIKPDLAAPGVAILSATSDQDTSSLNSDYARFNGTSMATPAVAGAAVLLKQYAPDLNAVEIKSILINSSESVVKNVSGEKAASAFETGAGRLNVLNALQATTYAKQPNMVAKYCIINCSINNELITFSDTSTTWKASLVFDDGQLAGEVVPNQLNLSGINKQANFSVNISAPLSLDEDWYFGRIQWSNNQGQVINQALAINNKQANSDLLRLTVSTKDSDSKSIKLISNNISTDDEIEVDLLITGGAEFTDGSLLVNGDNSHQVTNQLSNKVTILADVDVGRSEILPGTAPISVNLAESDVAPIACELAACDEVLYEIAFDFKHFGQTYENFLMNDNGLIIAGDDLSLQSDLAFNLSFPDQTAPDNIIAPFWTDFDLINLTEPDDQGGGEMFVAYYELSGTKYLVLQWNKVQLYTDERITAADLGVSRADLEFTFQLILQENSENKWFRYIDIPEQPNFYSVGTENSAGTQGGTYWFDGDGINAVSSGEELSLQLDNIGVLTVDIDIDKKPSDTFTQNDNIVASKNDTININVLANDLASDEQAILTTSVNGFKQISTLFSSDSELSLVNSTLAITSAPEHGQARIITDGIITYTPNTNFSGDDQLRYSVENNLGQISSSLVNIEIVVPNNAPQIISSQIPSTMNEGETVTFSVVAQDDDSDLTYAWIIPSPLTVVSTTNAETEVTLGAFSQLQIVTVSVTVSDNENTVFKTVDITLIPDESDNDEDKDKGFLGLALNLYLQTLLILLLMSRRLVRRSI